MTVQDFIAIVESKRGTASGWPACLTYTLEGDQAIITMIKGFGKKEFRRFDSWGMAFVAEAECETSAKVSAVSFTLPNDNIDGCEADFEAFRRRVSFLNINNTLNHLTCQIVRNGEPIPLYDEHSLFNRPQSERIRPLRDIKKAKDNTPGHIEKDFQTFLFGNDCGKEENTNERLAILGEEFFNLKKKEFGLIREFPTGAFRDCIKEENRILPTEYIDIVTLNKYGRLSVIELKLNDSQLEVISQILDYALFFSCYIKTLKPEIKEKFERVAIEEPIVCYVVNNHFHEKFDKIMKYYSTSNKCYNFELKKVLLGHALRI